MKIEISNVTLTRWLILITIGAMFVLAGLEIIERGDEIEALQETQSLLNPPPDTVIVFQVTTPDSNVLKIPMATYKELYDILKPPVNQTAD